MSGGNGNFPYTGYQLQPIIQAAKNAGFSGLGLVIILAIARAESGYNTSAKNVNNDSFHSVDRGILQINNHWHSEVSDSCAYDLQCSFNAAYRISQHGTNFSEWATFNSQNGQVPAFYAYVSYISTLVNVPIPSNWQALESQAQNNNVKNVPVVGGIVNGVQTVTNGVGNFFQELGQINSIIQWFNNGGCLRIGIFSLGGLVIIGGLIILSSGNYENNTEDDTEHSNITHVHKVSKLRKAARYAALA